jgi:L-asparagine transporter-like permease
MHSTSSQGHLERRLKNRHIQLIALGGTIGTGLFLGSAGIIELAGPSLLLGYAIGGLIIFCIMRFLGEMLVEEPNAGSFSFFANRYVGRFAGFLSGWNCVALYVLVGMLELTAAGKFIQFWWPGIPSWVTAAVFFVLINGVNFINVKAYGEFEFWFSLIKIVAVMAMIGAGLYLLVSADRPGQTVSNLWTHGGFFPNGFSGLVMAFAFIMFAFGGVEMLGFAAAETDQPRTVIPKAVNQLIYRVLAVYNSMVYSNSRLLYGMASEGNAPRSLMQVNGRGVPVRAIVYPAIFTALAIVLNYVAPAGVLELLMSLIVAALVITWTIIIVAHWRFRRAHVARRTVLGFPAPLAPLSNGVCLAAMALVVGVMLLTPAIRTSALAIPVWILLVWGAYRIIIRQRPGQPSETMAEPALAAAAHHPI